MRVPMLVAALACGALATASANGRYPATNGVHFEPGDSQSIYLATTFGLLVSHDNGCDFYWVCEQAMGYGGMFDPKYAVGSDGTLYVATYSGLRVSPDGGCSFTTAGSDLGSNDPNNFSTIWVDALEIGPTGEIWVGTAESGRTNNVFASRDHGATFPPKNLQSSQIWWKSVKVAPSDDQRVYVSGYQVSGTAADGGQLPPTATMVRSDDDGSSWAPSALTGVRYGFTPQLIINAVDPVDEDILFVTSIGAGATAAVDGGATNGDILYRSADGGATLTLVLTTNAPIADVAIIDSSHVMVAATTDGPYESTDGGQTFAKLAGAPQLSCVGKRGDGSVFGCGTNWGPDFKALALEDASGSAWTDVFRFVKLDGPLTCGSATTTHMQCNSQWPMLQQQFGSTGSTCGLPVDGLPDAPPGKDSPPPPAKSGSGCCDAGAGGPASLLLGLGVAVVIIRRRGSR